MSYTINLPWWALLSTGGGAFILTSLLVLRSIWKKREARQIEETRRYDAETAAANKRREEAYQQEREQTAKAEKLKRERALPGVWSDLLETLEKTPDELRLHVNRLPNDLSSDGANYLLAKFSYGYNDAASREARAAFVANQRIVANTHVHNQTLLAQSRAVVLPTPDEIASGSVVMDDHAVFLELHAVTLAVLGGAKNGIADEVNVVAVETLDVHLVLNVEPL